MMKKLRLFVMALVALCHFLPLSAQEAGGEKPQIAVTGFRCLPNDLTARITEPRKDQNGEPCALIRIVTGDKNVYFEADALGIVAREDRPGEIWLYVPRGARRLNIKHEQYGVIRNYMYPEAIKGATTYELTLHVPRAVVPQKPVTEKATEKKVTAQILQMKFAPAGARLYIDGVEQKTIDGVLSMALDCGKHTYRLEYPLYETEQGEFEIVPERPTVLQRQLAQNVTMLSVTSNKKADIYIDDEWKATAKSYQDTLPLGQHSIVAHYKKGKKEKQFFLGDERMELHVQFRPEFLAMLQVSDVFSESKASSGGRYYNASTRQQLGVFYGMLLGLCGGSHGGYISLRHHKGTRDKKDGTETYPFSYSLTFVTAGYLWHPVSWAYFRLGGGVDMQSVKDDAAKVVNEVSWIAEAGPIFRINHILLSLGYHYHSSSLGDLKLHGKHELSAGIGFVF